MNFCSDNAVGVTPEIMDALAHANRGASMPYGADDWTQRVEKRLADIFEHPVRAFPVATGTAANSLALSTLTPPYGAVLLHEEAHAITDECGAPEFFSGGAKMKPVPGAHGKLTADTLSQTLDRTRDGDIHHMQPTAISLTQASEAGTVYTPTELQAIGDVARRHKVRLHMDGARFGNAVASLGVPARQVTWEAGIDVLSFGATKGGAMGAEMVVFFDPELATDFEFRRKRAGQLFSKMRFVSAQLEAYLTDDLWLRMGRHANAMAQRLARGINAALPGLKGGKLHHPVEANELFVELPASAVAALRKAGFDFYEWPGTDGVNIRLVTAFNTEPAHVDLFVTTVAEAGTRAA
jgi:threonine aldolase